MPLERLICGGASVPAFSLSLDGRGLGWAEQIRPARANEAYPVFIPTITRMSLRVRDGIRHVGRPGIFDARVVGPSPEGSQLVAGG